MHMKTNSHQFDREISSCFYSLAELKPNQNALYAWVIKPA